MHITRISSLSKRLQIMEHNVDVQSFYCFILGLVRIFKSPQLLTNRFKPEPFYSNVVLTQDA